MKTLDCVSVWPPLPELDPEWTMMSVQLQTDQVLHIVRFGFN
jgi:hypothetical protein